MRAAGEAVRERAPAKVNLLLHVGPRRPDGLHELCSLLASIDLADELVVSRAPDGADRVVCAGVPGPNICATALAAFRAAFGDRRSRRARGGVPAVPALEVTVEKRIPVAAGLGGGSADAAAVLRAANEIAGRPLDAEALREVGAGVGADVPSQVEPRHALVQGAGERVQPVALPAMPLVLLPQAEGLATADVYREADRIGATRPQLDPERVRALAASPARTLRASLENDLQAAALSLRPALAESIAALEREGATKALVTGSGPTVFGVFDDARSARRAAARLPHAMAVAMD